jgi:2-dehydropantoate 2-reductase
MKIAVVGVGGIGSTFAFNLVQIGKHEVTVVARAGSKRMAQLQRDQGILNQHGEIARVKITDALDVSIAYDIVLVTLKAYQIESLIDTLKSSAAKKIQFMGNNFEPERLLEFIGAERCLFGMPFVQGFVDDDGKIHSTIGAGGQKTIMNDPAWAKVFRDAGLPAVVETNMPLWLKCHVPMCIAFESISFAGMQRNGGAAWSEARTISTGVKECFVLIERLGFQIYPATKLRLRKSPIWLLALILWCMSRIKSFRELLATGMDECESLVGKLCTIAEKTSPAVDIAKIKAILS